MGIPWTQAKVVNTPDNPLPVSPLGVDSFFATRTGILAVGSGETTLIQVLYPSVIEVLEVSGNAANAPRVRIQRRKPDGSFENMTFPAANGAAAMGMTPSIVNSDGCAIFDITAYDAASSKYKMVLNRPLAFPNGFMITLSNQAASDQNVAATVYGRVLK